MKEDVFNLVVESIDLEIDTMEKKQFENGRFLYIDAIDKNSFADVSYLIYSCEGEHKFCYDDWNNISKKIEDEFSDSFFIPVFVFDDLDCETLQFESVYNNLKTAKEKKEINLLFERKKSIYTRSGKISLKIDDRGINYLEYGKDGFPISDINLNGYIYNISYYELKKIFVLRGKDLFRENIRYGINKPYYTKDKISKNFEKYLRVGVYQKIIEHSDKANIYNENIKEILEIDDDTIMKFSPEIFWFNHNGVTISITFGRINRCNDTIEFDSRNASIINGAQTMTNMYRTVNDIKKLLINDNGELANSDKTKYILSEQDINDIVDGICKKIYLKTIFIEGDNKFIKGISDGLNTQIPISEVDILASSEYVEKINDELLKERITIIKVGEQENKNQISVITFAKLYKIILGMPGTSKNLNRNKVKDILKQATNDCGKGVLARNIRMAIDADEWWKKNRNDKTTSEAIDDDEINILKYGKNYFDSYVILNMPDNTDDELLSNIYFDFIRDSKEANIPKTLNQFKKDDLFNEIKRIYDSKKETQVRDDEQIYIIENFMGDLVEYLNIHKKNNYAINKLITRFFEGKNIYLHDFRVISVKKEFGVYSPLEAYPFSSSSFSELYLNIDYSNEKGKFPQYDYSTFKKEIEKNQKIFIIEKDKDGNIKNALYFNDFSFKKYDKEAREVFEKTLKAFKEGNEEDFVKASDDIKFHIRTKARNSDDTFEFSNGKEITKRTFWANKKTIKEILKMKI